MSPHPTPEEPQQEVTEVESDLALDIPTALQIAEEFVAQEIEGGTIIDGDDPYEEDGRLYFAPGRGGSTAMHLLMDCPQVFVDQATGEVGWDDYKPEPEEEVDENG